MKKIFFYLFIIFPLYAVSQNSVKDSRRSSWQTFVYKITAAQTEKYIKWDSIPLNRFINEEPMLVLQADSVENYQFLVGNYVLIRITDNNVTAELLNISALQLLTINNRKQLQLDIKNAEGEYITDCKIFVNKRKTYFNKDAKTFWVKQRNIKEAIVKVYAAGDTLYRQINEEYEPHPSLAAQKKLNWKFTKIYKVLNWLPAKLIGLFKQEKENYSGSGNGYIIFNQPKYRLLDTVKFKGYVVDKKWKQYKKAVSVYLNYYSNRVYYKKKLQVLKPTTPGAFIGEFIIADTIPVNVDAELIFRTSKNKKIISNKFKVEDYLLDDIGTYNFSSNKQTYFKNDSMIFSASAKDANGLNLLDATATLVLTTRNINKVYHDTLFIADTLFMENVKMSTTTETTFHVPPGIFPKADLQITATLIYTNSNNELKEKNVYVDIDYTSKTINVKQDADSLHVVYVEDGVEKISHGLMKMDESVFTPVIFPVHIKIDPFTRRYYFKQVEGKDTLYTWFNVQGGYRPVFTRISSKDTLGFVINNFYKTPIYYTIFSNKKVIATGKQSAENITWTKIMKDRRQSYKVCYQYFWAGRERYESFTIGLLYKLLNIRVNTNEQVYPGQKDSLNIHVSDYKGDPVSKVNLTAVSYNNQFKNIIVKELPYLVKYKGGKFIERQEYGNDEPGFFRSKYSLGKNMVWFSKFKLDTMSYYKLLFPASNYVDEVTAVRNFVPQLFINVVDKGIPQNIYLLYLKGQLVYYSEITGNIKYAFQVFPGIVRIGIRTIDKYIEIDSVYIQPNYKHDIIFDLNNLPLHSRVTKMEKSWSKAEINLLENSIGQFNTNSYNKESGVWQNEKLITLKGYGNHLAGPFRKDEINFFNPDSFDIHFNFEPGYIYNLSKQVIQIEKRNLFPERKKKYLLPVHTNNSLLLGDTLIDPPTITYALPGKASFFLPDPHWTDHWYGSKLFGTGAIQFELKKDTALKYIILHEQDSNSTLVLLPVNYKKIQNIRPGKYSLLLVANNEMTVSFVNIMVKANGTACVNTNKYPFITNDSLLNKLIAEAAIARQQQNAADTIIKHHFADNLFAPTLTKDLQGGSISGILTDAKGNNPLSFCSVKLKGYYQTNFTDAAGEFMIDNIPLGRYIIVFSAVGYETKEVEVFITKFSRINLQVKLFFNQQELTSVVVTAMGTQKFEKELSYSTVRIRLAELTSINLQNGLTGRVAGLNIQSTNNNMFADSRITLRGIASLSGNNQILYVVNGIIVSDIASINPNNILDVTIMKRDEAIAIFGERGINGAVIITTNDLKTLRKEFRDYAFWQPNFFTDKNGNASFEVTYPDNVTGWKTFIIGMDKKRRIGKTSFLIQSYKPLLAQLSLPQFLLEGDSSVAIGKSLNYTDDTYSIHSSFTFNGEKLRLQQKELLPKAAGIDEQIITAKNTDTISTSFTIESTSGFKDEEEHKIPVFKKGTEETIGQFWELQNDITVSFNTSLSTGGFTIYAQNNTLDLLMDDLKHLRAYPYSCMEQTASKLLGLSMEKKILEMRNESFHDQKIMDRLLHKVQKAQLYDGGWSWWENGKANFYISNYITLALLQFRGNVLVETNIQNGFLFLYNQLPFLKKGEILASLFTLSDGKYVMDYNFWLAKVEFDQLSQHQQWQWIKIEQQQHMDYQEELKKLVNNKTETMLGGIHWGIDNYSWYSNDIATTVIAFSVLVNEPAYKNILPAITRYFLEKRRNGYWRNTVESASIINVLLPFIEEREKSFTTPASIFITGDTSFTITKFPYKMTTNNASIKNINIAKTGGGLVYFTAYKKIFNATPTPINDKFIVHTSFKKEGKEIAIVKAGEKITLVLRVEVLSDADYVMFKVPIPAGCTYENRNNNDPDTYKQFFKDKLLMFKEFLKKGVHNFEIELEPRYSGRYTLNPATVELMYYPTFFGRNEMKEVLIVK